MVIFHSFLQVYQAGDSSVHLEKSPSEASGPSFFNSVEVYDCLSDTWEVLPSMATRRHGATACKLNGKVYVMGGMHLVLQRCFGRDTNGYKQQHTGHQ